MLVRAISWTLALAATVVFVVPANGQELVAPETTLASQALAFPKTGESSITSAAMRLLEGDAPLSDVAENEGSPTPKIAERASIAMSQLLADLQYRLQSPGGTATGSAAAGDTQRIIGNQTWERVTNTKAVPFNAVCQLRAKFPNTPSNQYSQGTGFFVHPRVLITNAHLVHQKDQGGWAKSIEVIPGKNGPGTTSSAQPYGSQFGSRFFAPSEWVNASTQNNRDYDIAWVILPDRTLFNRVGYAFGYKTTTDSELKTAKLNMSGYPGSKSDQQWREYGGGNQVVSTSQYRHYLDSVGGSSGSPMYLFNSSTSQRHVVGVNCAESTGSTAYNVATRMTSRYFNSTQQYNSQYP